jgi:hypothetical protein
VLTAVSEDIPDIRRSQDQERESRRQRALARIGALHEEHAALAARPYLFGFCLVAAALLVYEESGDEAAADAALIARAYRLHARLSDGGA